MTNKKSNYHRNSKHLRKSRSGVSEIIGNLLILAITVSLFSGVLFFVSNMPAPQDSTFGDFSSKVALTTNGALETLWVNITHKGGQILTTSTTGIIIYVNNVPTQYHISDSATNLSGQWKPGDIWSKKFTSIANGSTVSVIVTDLSTNSIVWQSDLVGGTSANTPPIIANRGMDPSPTYAGDTVVFYAVVQDINNDLDNSQVFINASSIGLSSHIALTYNPVDGRFVSGSYTALKTWDLQIIQFSATDKTNFTAQASSVLHILSGGSDSSGTVPSPYDGYLDYYVNGTYPPDATGGETRPEGISFYYIRNATTGAITHNFLPGGGVRIEVYSSSLSNLAIENSFTLYEPITGNPLTPPSKVTAFQYNGTMGTFWKYVYNFTAPNTPYQYPIQVKMKDNRGYSMNIMETLSVGTTGYPHLVTAVQGTGNSLVNTYSFKHTDTVYLKIIMKDVDLSASTVYVSNVQITDYTGKYVIMKTPPTYTATPSYSAPLSSVFKTSGTDITPAFDGSSSGVYTVKIVLKDAEQGWWLANRNAYDVKIDLVSDTGTGATTAEVYHSLSCQINVTAPLRTSDLLASLGKGDFKWSSSGANFDQEKITWLKGGGQWDMQTITDVPNKGATALALADINGDGAMDVIAASQDPTQPNVVWYENIKGDGSLWSAAQLIAPSFDARAGTQASLADNNFPQTFYDSTGQGWHVVDHYRGSNAKDNTNEDNMLYAGTVEGNVQVQTIPDGLLANRYITDYAINKFITNCDWDPASGVSTNEVAVAMAVTDLNHDGKADIVVSFVHVVAYTNSIDSTQMTSANTWLLAFNRGVYVYWNDGSWTKTALNGTTAFLTKNNDNMDTNPAYCDLAVGDFNMDGYNDIAGVTEDGTTTVWTNHYNEMLGSPYSRETDAFGPLSDKKTVPKLTDGTLPWSRPGTQYQYYPKVKIADVNGDGYPDIIRTTMKSNDVTVFYTQIVDSGINTRLGGAGWSIDPTEKTKSAVAGSVQTLTEVYKNYTQFSSVLTSKMTTGGYLDTTGSLFANVTGSDTSFYAIPYGGSRMGLTGFAIDPMYADAVVTKATLTIHYKTDAGYAAGDKLQWAIPSVFIMKDTSVVIGSTTNTTTTYDLLANGADTWTKLTTIQLSLVDSSANKNIYVDYIGLDVKFVQTRWLGWEWKLQNDVAEFHNLTVTARTAGSPAESFSLDYSVDNTTWFNLGTIANTTDQTNSYRLIYTPSAYYYVRVTDNDRTTTDTVNNNLIISTMSVRNWGTSASWDIAHKTTISAVLPTTMTVNSNSVLEYLTAIEVGDMGAGGHGLKDIVIGTSRVGQGDSTHSVFIATQTSLGTFHVDPMYTPNLAIRCPDDTVYDVRDLELGDFNGDGNLDVIVVIGPPSVINVAHGSGPTLWYYSNQLVDIGSTGYWSFAEDYIAPVANPGYSAINVVSGYIDLTMLLPFAGLAGIVVVESVLVGKKKKQ